MPIRSRILNALPFGLAALTAAAPAHATPGALIASYSVGNANQTPTGNLIAGLLQEYSYSADIAPLTLNPGIGYYLGITDKTSGYDWGQEASSSFGFHYQKHTATGWMNEPQYLAFNLIDHGTVAYDGGSPELQTVYIADRNSAFFTEDASLFTLSSGSDTIDAIRWWGGCAGIAVTCPVGDFIINVYAGPAVAAPEPESLMLLALGTVLLMLKRHRVT